MNPENEDSWQVLWTGNDLKARTGVRLQVLDSLPCITLEPHDNSMVQIELLYKQDTAINLVRD